MSNLSGSPRETMRAARQLCVEEQAAVSFRIAYLHSQLGDSGSQASLSEDCDKSEEHDCYGKEQDPYQ
jgi:hypothetical protein